MKRLALLIVCGLLTQSNLAIGASKVIKVDRPLDIPSFVGYVQDEFIVVLQADRVPSIGARALRSENAFASIAEFESVNLQLGVLHVRKQFVTTSSSRAASALERRLAQYLKVRFQNGSLDEAMAAYAQIAAVEHVEPIGIHRLDLEPNDTYYDNPPGGFPHNAWHIKQSLDNDIDGNDAWDTQTGDATVVVANLDSGHRYNHLPGVIYNSRGEWGHR